MITEESTSKNAPTETDPTFAQPMPEDWMNLQKCVQTTAYVIGGFVAAYGIYILLFAW